jgi:uncharacterized membrane protein
MQHQWINQRISRVALGKRLVAVAIVGAGTALCAPLPVRAGGQAETAVVDEAQAGDIAATSRNAVYSVINLGPEAGVGAYLNERGHAAFGSILYDGISNGFFDGDRVHDIGTLGGSYSWVWALNKQGVVVGESEDGEEHSNILGFAWTVHGGMRALPGASASSARDINDRNYIVGRTQAPDISARAIRWNPDGSVTPLGPLPTSLSEAFTINNRGLATGFTDVASGAIHATLWDRNGYLTDLGTLGGERAFGTHINERNEVAGESDNAANDRTVGFFWSRNSGMVPIDVEGGGTRLVADLNDRGEVVGDTVIADRSVAYHWTLMRGLVPLPSGSATRSDVFDINNRSEMVGLVERPAADGGGLRAVRWPAISAPIDLNTRLYRAPAGLVLQAGAAINDDGVILAHSNAGLVMLRPGRRGTDAPVLGPVLGFPDELSVGQDLPLTVGFVDNNGAETHQASVLWSDECASPAATVSEARGVGQVRLQHRFCAAGLYSVKVRVTDSGGRSTGVQQDVVVNEAGLASLSGKGALANGGSLGRGYRDLPLRFALWAPLRSGGRSGGRVGSPVVSFSGPFHFRSDQVTGTAGSGQQARVEGTGRLNGRAGYHFLLEAYDGNGQGSETDRLRVRVTHVDAATGIEAVDYDNGASTKGAARSTTDRTSLAEGALTLRN